MPVELSMNELDALCKKAARGAGFSWGLAEETGKAVRWLAEHDLAGPEALSRLLTSADFQDSRPGIVVEGNDWRPKGGRLDPLTLGASLVDHAKMLKDAPELRAYVVEEPLLLVPFLIGTARDSGEPFQMSLGTAIVLASPQGEIEIRGEIPMDAPLIRISSETQQQIEHPWTRKAVVCVVDDEINATLDRLAFLTYAPSTDDARLGNAGAGLSDND